MKMFMRDQERERAGFTLAELLIVVAIIAILVAIMIPVFSGARANAILAKDTANIRSAYADEVVKAMTTSTYGDSGKLKVEIDARELGIDDSTEVKLNNGSISITNKNATNGNSNKTTNLIIVDTDVHLTLITKDKTYVFNAGSPLDIKDTAPKTE